MRRTEAAVRGNNKSHSLATYELAVIQGNKVLCAPSRLALVGSFAFAMHRCEGTKRGSLVNFGRHRPQGPPTFVHSVAYGGL